MDSLPGGLPALIVVYNRLFWLFVLVITALILVMCYLYLAMRRSLQRESQSLAFSHLAILGLETERRRISRELHDTVLPLVADPAVSALIRSISMELNSPDFTRLSLKDSLAGLCSQCNSRSEIECVCSIEEDPGFAGLSAESQLHLYRMVQEAFTNIEKHSRANRVSLVARSYNRGTAKNILICVSDDGIGLQNSKENDAAGLGMRSMRQRAAIIGARLDFISESGNGLMVRIEIPPSHSRANSEAAG